VRVDLNALGARLDLCAATKLIDSCYQHFDLLM
jgi:hypothetical protein